jgi:hypothetical protein
MNVPAELRERAGRAHANTQGVNVGKNVAVFVDVANIFYAAKAAGVDIDYVTLLKSATAGRDLVRAYAYTGSIRQREPAQLPRLPAPQQLQGRQQGHPQVRRRQGQGQPRHRARRRHDEDGRNLDIAIVVSGDGDFAPAIRAVQEQGVRVEVISFRGNTSSDLIDVADQFTDIVQLAGSRRARAPGGASPRTRRTCR